MYEDVLQHYRSLLKAHSLEEGACWAVIRGLTRPLPLEEVTRRLDADPAGLERLPVDEWPQFDESPVYLITTDDVVMTLEPRGGRLSSPFVLAEVSTGAETWSVYWDVNLHSSLAYARNGQVVTSDDFLYEPVTEQPFAAWADLLAEWVRPGEDDESQYERTLARQWAAGMAVVELASGVRLTAQALRGPVPAIVHDHEDEDEE
ncbi:DUF6461 domain-containing protein [Actinomadura sp. ATCC 31491]|uniref:DUF6461 domain-containing protein n=1 Tax=Actinomadura luzonensis TaxID=2805427 RepID=A0ABT0FIS4_9ACTN|nr:DUF6461 domain-containing protein [Actinomadura luzonensis]MCK2212214.1 DUF6461 domain-containing protein [Actinomadura luzonensis]